MVFNPKVAEQFNFVDSSSTRFQWDVWERLVFPDENFAREVMQLFTIGLHHIELDGSETPDEFGRPIQTYTHDDITANARVLTGFVHTARRGNTEELFRAGKSRFEPLRMNINRCVNSCLNTLFAFLRVWFSNTDSLITPFILLHHRHDFFPKLSLDAWIGDRYPLCIDLPKYHFLKIGATYQLRGGSSLPRSHYMPESWDGNEEIKRFILSPDSSLYQKLCNPDANGNCNYLNTISLDENLDCTGKECRIDTLVIVQVAPGLFYEYIRQPCTHLSFYDGGKKVITGFTNQISKIGRKYTVSLREEHL